jgi:hypothetical protein
MVTGETWLVAGQMLEGDPSTTQVALAVVSGGCTASIVLMQGHIER